MGVADITMTQVSKFSLLVQESIRIFSHIGKISSFISKENMKSDRKFVTEGTSFLGGNEKKIF